VACNGESWGRKKGKQYYGTGHSFVLRDHQAIIPGYDAEWILQSYISTVGQATTIVQICNFGEQSWPWAVWVILVWVIQINWGQTGRCRTYNNPPLTPDPAGILFRLSLEV
jgi:hypothetical protein